EPRLGLCPYYVGRIKCTFQEKAKRNGLESHAWLTDVLTHLSE
ncbi:transposase domain-containing protein, partial [Escherichia coli]|nr:transposase domain-containing protein [Escherichia coli]EFB1461900.1 transposase domain-containing protein [Escherichia coli]EFC1586697.1 transposase domain-containing protein [Escherichia coli]EFE9640427.1 transposase domain-containing protein [Escherichia coli]EFE9645106.1 transposase domain-containing protein [Escherichia coli]